MFRKPVQSIFIQFLVFVFAFESVALPVNANSGQAQQRVQTSAPASPKKIAAPTHQDLMKFTQVANKAYFTGTMTGFNGMNPALADIMAVPESVIRENAPRFEGRPEVDMDPFAMRSGRWVPTERIASDYLIEPTRTGIELLIPGARNKLVLDMALRPIWANEEFLVLSAHSSSNMFAEKAGVKDNEGESLFVIEVPRLQVMAAKMEPVPVFSLPIQGNGWRENTSALHQIEGDILSVTNGQYHISFWMSDIREVIAYEKNLLDAAVMMTMLDPKTWELAKNPNYRVLPAPGATAAFGTIFTGLNLDRPGWNVFRSPWPTEKSTASLEKPNFFAGHNAWVKVVLNKFLNNKAQAQAGSADPVRKALMNSLFFITLIGAVAVISAFLLKYKPIKNRLDVIWAKRAEFDPKQAKQENRLFKDYFHIVGSLTTSIAQFPLILPGLSARYQVDRWMPYWGSAKHKLLAILMNFTVLPGLRHFGDLTVTAKPTLLGSGYAATLGVGASYLMSFHALPAFAKYIGPWMGDAMNFALNNAFNSGNAEVNALLITSLLVSSTIGVLRGAADFTMDAKSRVIEGISAKVDTKLRERGKNPNDPKIHSQREALINTEFDKTLVQLGLPTSYEKLFDAMSLFQAINHVRGYGNPTMGERVGNLNPMNDKIEDISAKLLTSLEGDSFTLNTRRGLLPWVLKRAQQQAEQWHAAEPSIMTAQALKLANDAIAESILLEKAIKTAANHFYEIIRDAQNGQEVNEAMFDPEKIKQLQAEIEAISKQAFKFRRLITVSNYEGGISYISRYVPRDWVNKYGVEGSNAFVLYMRKGLASFLDVEGNDSLAPRAEDVRKYLAKAEETAMEDLRKLPEYANRSVEEIKANPEVRSQLELRASLIADQLGHEERARDAADKFKPESDWYERWVHRRALKAAEARMFRYQMDNRSANAFEVVREMREVYVSELSKRIGLHIQDVAPVSSNNKRSGTELPWYGKNDAISTQEFAEIVRDTSPSLSYDEYQKLAARVNDAKAGERVLNQNQRYQILLSEVRTAALDDTKSILKTQGMKAYRAKLSPTERRGLYLQVYANSFIEQYRTATTTSPLMSPVDPSQPGMTQRLRQALAAQTIRDIEKIEQLQTVRPDPWEQSFLRFRKTVIAQGTTVMNRSLRMVDSLFGDTTIAPTLMGVLARRVPLVEDVVTATIRNLYLLPVGLTFSWFWSHHVLRTGIGYDFWTAGFLFQGALYISLRQLSYRVYRQQGFMPFASVRNYLGDNVVELATSLPSAVVSILVLHQLTDILNNKIGVAIHQAVSSVSATEALTFLMAGAMAWVGGKYFEEWRASLVLKRIRLFGSRKGQDGPPTRESYVVEPPKNTPSPSNRAIRCEVLYGPHVLSVLGR